MPREREIQTGLDIKWDTDQLVAINKAAFLRGARKAAAFLAGQIKKNLSLAQSPPVSGKGEFPHIGAKRKGAAYGFLRNSVQSKGMPFGARVGVTVLYGLFLEIGTSKMAARPFIVPTYIQNLPQIKAIIAREMAEAHRGK